MEHTSTFIKNSEAPDNRISYNDAIDYWTGVPATVDGVLGGFGNTSLPKTDVKGSLSFFRRIASRYRDFEESGRTNSKYGCDIGAGIGRVTRDVLSKLCDKIDLVEPVAPFADQIPIELEKAGVSEKLGTIYKKPMQDFVPQGQKYWFIWCQWCLGQLKDSDLVEFLKRCSNGLQSDGMIFVKENNTSVVEDEFDETDSSVTRSDSSFRTIFTLAGLDLVEAEVQQGLPAGLYPVRTYALRPRNL
ncbi:alpha-N-methyltransferase NTM1 [Dipodascopsis uninucleata]